MIMTNAEIALERIAEAMSRHSVEFCVRGALTEIEKICDADARVSVNEITSLVKEGECDEKKWGSVHSHFDYSLIYYSIKARNGNFSNVDYGALVLSSYFLSLASRYDFGDWDGTFENILRTFTLLTQIETDLRARHLVIILEGRFQKE